MLDGKLTLVASIQSGLEIVLKHELINLGYEPSGAINGRISFEGTMKDVARANMFLRTASRVYVLLSKFKATTFDELFDSVNIIPWEDILPSDLGVVVTAKALKSTLMAFSSIQSITQKAIIVRLMKKRGQNRLPDKNKVTVEVSIYEDEVCVYLDTSGDALHKRGYRTLVGDAPLRETLAAGMILLSFWKHDRVLLDPFVGSGTIPIEAALIGRNIAPGKNRNFHYEKFANGTKFKDKALEEAISLEQDNALRIYGYDINPKAIKLAVKHATSAGVDKHIHFQTADMKTFSSRFAHGIIITNPPYGERLKSDNLGNLYSEFWSMYNRLDNWSAYILSAYPSVEKQFGKKADKVRKLHNADIKCNYYQYYGEPPASKNKS
jgi:putative N6-adenine-specific DNA methylase